MKISEIKIGKRFRKDIGDIESLKNSIQEIGLLQPIVVDEKNNLIAGLRRLKACEELGWNEIDVRIIEKEIYKEFKKTKENIEKEFPDVNKLFNNLKEKIDYLDNLPEEAGINKYQKEKTCSICFWSCGDIKAHSHHLLHKKDNGSNKKINRVRLCPNCHAVIHWFENYNFKYIDELWSDKTFKEIEECIKEDLQHELHLCFFDYNNKKQKEEIIQKLTNILLTKLIYILFYYEQ